MQLREIKKSQGFPITLSSLIREYCMTLFLVSLCSYYLILRIINRGFVRLFLKILESIGRTFLVYKHKGIIGF